ncbi:MAG: hypothetical protein ACRD0P_17665 [Stackebrandtia sp.]
MEIPPIRIGMTPDEVRDVAGAPDEAEDLLAIMREAREKAVAAGKVPAGEIPDLEDDDSPPEAEQWAYRDVPETGNMMMVMFKEGRVMIVSYAEDGEDRP